MANPGDPRWTGRRIWKEVVVRAPSAAMARLVAARMERDLDPWLRDNEAADFRSGFQDEKIYWVARINAKDAAAIESESGPDEVLESTILREPSVGSRSPLETGQGIQGNATSLE